MPAGATTLTWNAAFIAGSSKQGNACRALVDSNCVTARTCAAPSESVKELM